MLERSASIVAAVNALSDIYAMGGKPLTAMNIVCFPKKTLDKSVLKEILKGGLEKIPACGQGVCFRRRGTEEALGAPASRRS